MSYSDLSCVNSKFTKREVLNAFPNAQSSSNHNWNSKRENEDGKGDSMQVLYPAIDLNKFIPPDFESKTKLILQERNTSIVSLNRFERKKNIEVLLQAYAILHRSYNNIKNENNTNDLLQLPLPQLIIAGGYDHRNTENVEYLQELKDMAESLDIGQLTNFRPSVSDDERATLLQSAICVVYTPHREHFGMT